MLYDTRTIFFEYSKILDNNQTFIKILSTPNFISIYISQESDNSYLYSDQIYSFLKNKTRNKKLLIFCQANKIDEIKKEVEDVLSGRLLISSWE